MFTHLLPDLKFVKAKKVKTRISERKVKIKESEISIEKRNNKGGSTMHLNIKLGN